MVGDMLRSIFAMISMNLGTIHYWLSRGPQLSYYAAGHLELSGHFETTIEGLVKISTDLVRCRSLATLITSIPSWLPIPLSNLTPMTLRVVADFQTSSESDFSKTLVTGMYHWDKGIKWSGENFESAMAALQAFKEMPGNKDEMAGRIGGYLGGGSFKIPRASCPGTG